MNFQKVGLGRSGCQARGEKLRNLALGEEWFVHGLLQGHPSLWLLVQEFRQQLFGFF